MALTGYRSRCSKNSGGIARIRFIEVGNIINAQYDPTKDAYVSFSTSEGACFADYEFKQDGAFFSEKVNTHTGSIKVSHELSFILDRTDTESRVALEQIVEASWDGMVAIVTCNNGESFLVGYSETFLTERPMKLLRSTSVSGSRPAEQTSQTVYLYSEDTQKAKSYIGNI